MARLQLSLQFPVSVHKLVVLTQGYLHLILSPLERRSQFLYDLVRFFQLVRLLHMVFLVLRFHVRLFKL